jgi:hypothetical protein
VRVSAVARVGSRTVALGSTTRSSPAAGTDVTEIRLSGRAWKALRSARRAQIVVTLSGAQGGAAVEAPRTLRR